MKRCSIVSAPACVSAVYICVAFLLLFPAEVCSRSRAAGAVSAEKLQGRGGECVRQGPLLYLSDARDSLGVVLKRSALYGNLFGAEHGRTMLWPGVIVPPEDATDTLTVRIIGDVMLHTRQIETAHRADGAFDFSPFLSGISEQLRSADLAIAGMEFTLAGKPYTGYPSFSAPDSYADYVADCGVDVFLTANNHILDKGPRGLERTLRYYGDMENVGTVRYTGCEMPGDTLRNPLILRVKGVKIAIVNCTYGTNAGGEIAGGARVVRMDAGAVSSMITRARAAGADIVLVCPHWGAEYTLSHGREQEHWARRMADWGADVIVGAHPHVVQDWEVIETSDGRRVPVYYSVGNAVSNMSARNTQLGLMVEVRISRDALGNVALAGTSGEWIWCTLPGDLSRSYQVIPVDGCPAREDWLRPAAYDKMLSTCSRIAKRETAPKIRHGKIQK